MDKSPPVGWMGAGLKAGSGAAQSCLVPQYFMEIYRFVFFFAAFAAELCGKGLRAREERSFQ